MAGDKLLAVLIDGDNASASIISGLLAEVAKFGGASVKRIYGDWTKPNLGGWKDVLLRHSIQPIQQFAYTTGKNATDGAMIIDAMDLLYTGRFDGFCLVSSDSDFTRLAARIREQGLSVYGFGEAKTPDAFRQACTRFIETEVLRAPEEVARPADPPKTRRADVQLVARLRNAIDQIADEEGWANLSEFGSQMRRQSPDFDHRAYGFSQLGGLLESVPALEVARDGGRVRVRVRR